MMLLRQRASACAALARTRAYATPTNMPPPSGPVAEAYDPEEDPQLAGMGYPKLPTTSRQLRNPRGWWDTQERIAFGEPVPENDDVQSMWAPDVHAVKPSSAFLQLMTMFAAVAVFSVGVYASFNGRPNLPRAYPYDGLVKELSGTEEETFAARPTSANEIEDDE